MSVGVSVGVSVGRKTFHHVGLIGRAGKNTADTLVAVIDYLLSQQRQVSVEEKTAELIEDNHMPIFSEKKIPKDIDIIIVVGGDGSLLNAVHCALPNGLPVLGINRGRLGFLTDISPSNLSQMGDVLSGNYITEKRFLLEAKAEGTPLGNALNDVVLLPGDSAQMIEFDIVIDNQFVCHQRADGLIIATPTGSTAYALSGGGPILHPYLNAIVLVPMFPHTLSSRPIVIDGNANIELLIYEHRDHDVAPSISCDGQHRIKIQPGSRINIHKHEKEFTLIHPENYQYYERLRDKLGWHT